MCISGILKILIIGNIDWFVLNLIVLFVDYGGVKLEIVMRGWMDL